MDMDEMKDEIDKLIEKIPKGEKGDVGERGPRGPIGMTGKDGRDGETPIPGIDFPIPKDGKDGINGKKGDRGEDGKTPQKGVDFFTPREVSQVVKKASEKAKMSGKMIVEAINNLPIKQELQIDPSHIKEFAIEGPRFGGAGAGGGGGGDLITLSTTDGSITGTIPGTTFTLSRKLKNPQVYTRGLRQTSGYTFSNNNLTLTFTNEQRRGAITVDGQPA